MADLKFTSELDAQGVVNGANAVNRSLGQLNKLSSIYLSTIWAICPLCLIFICSWVFKAPDVEVRIQQLHAGWQNNLPPAVRQTLVLVLLALVQRLVDKLSVKRPEIHHRRGC